VLLCPLCGPNDRLDITVFVYGKDHALVDLAHRGQENAARVVVRAAPRATPFSAGGAAIVSAGNLKVLTAQNVEITMQNITFALGVVCVYCHDLNDLSLDTKPQKVKARMMLEMVRDINAKFGDGKTHVTVGRVITPQPSRRSPNHPPTRIVRVLARKSARRGRARLASGVLLTGG
jgi:hypothetical protein